MPRQPVQLQIFAQTNLLMILKNQIRFTLHSLSSTLIQTFKLTSILIEFDRINKYESFITNYLYIYIKSE